METWNEKDKFFTYETSDGSVFKIVDAHIDPYFLENAEIEDSEYAGKITIDFDFNRKEIFNGSIRIVLFITEDENDSDIISPEFCYDGDTIYITEWYYVIHNFEKTTYTIGKEDKKIYNKLNKAIEKAFGKKLVDWIVEYLDGINC